MQPSSSLFVTKNYLENNFTKPIVALNTGFDIWARGTSITQATQSSFNNYTADCWTFSTFPSSQGATIARIANFMTSNKLSRYCWKLSLSSATPSLATSSQYYLSNRLDGSQARFLLGRQVVINGKARTNKAGIYTVFVAFLNQEGTQVTYSASPINLLGLGVEESFQVTLPITTPSLTPVVDESLSAYYGITLAGNKTTVTGVALTASIGSEAFCHSSQVNIFDSASNYFEVAQFQIVPDIYPKAYLPIPPALERSLCRKYFERIGTDIAGSPLSVAFADSGNILRSTISYEEKRATPTITISSQGGITVTANGTDTISSAVSFSSVGKRAAIMNTTAAGSITAGSAVLPSLTTTTDYISIDASL